MSDEELLQHMRSFIKQALEFVLDPLTDISMANKIAVMRAWLLLKIYDQVDSMHTDVDSLLSNSNDEWDRRHNV